MSNKFDMSVYDEPQCEEYFEDDSYGMVRIDDNEPSSEDNNVEGI